MGSCDRIWRDYLDRVPFGKQTDDLRPQSLGAGTLRRGKRTDDEDSQGPVPATAVSRPLARSHRKTSSERSIASSTNGHL